MALLLAAGTAYEAFRVARDIVIPAIERAFGDEEEGVASDAVEIGTAEEAIEEEDSQETLAAALFKQAAESSVFESGAGGVEHAT